MAGSLPLRTSQRRFSRITLPAPPPVAANPEALLKQSHAERKKRQKFIQETRDAGYEDFTEPSQPKPLASGEEKTAEKMFERISAQAGARVIRGDDGKPMLIPHMPGDMIIMPNKGR